MFLLSSLVANLGLFVVGLHYSSSLFSCQTFFITLMKSYRQMPSILIWVKLLIVSLMTSYWLNYILWGLLVSYGYGLRNTSPDPSVYPLMALVLICFQLLLVFPREAFSVHCYFLFSLMTFHLSSTLSRYCYNYADDTKCYHPIGQLSESSNGHGFTDSTEWE